MLCLSTGGVLVQAMHFLRSSYINDHHSFWGLYMSCLGEKKNMRWRRSKKPQIKQGREKSYSELTASKNILKIPCHIKTREKKNKKKFTDYFFSCFSFFSGTINFMGSIAKKISENEFLH